MNAVTIEFVTIAAVSFSAWGALAIRRGRERIRTVLTLTAADDAAAAADTVELAPVRRPVPVSSPNSRWPARHHIPAPRRGPVSASPGRRVPETSGSGAGAPPGGRRRPSPGRHARAGTSPPADTR